MNLEYKEAIGEVLLVLKHTEKELTDKIPKKMLEFLEKNAISKSDFIINANNKIEDIILSQKSKALLGMIYRNYWCDVEERKEFDKILIQNAGKVQEENQKREYLNLREAECFETRVVEEKIDEYGIVPYKVNIFIKLVQKVRSLFRNKKQVEYKFKK